MAPVGKTNNGVVHISRANSPGHQVRTECGRAISYIGTYRGTASQLAEADEKTGEVESKHGWAKLRLCKRCGTRDDFVKAFEDYVRLHGERIRKINEEREYIEGRIQEFNSDMFNVLKEFVEKAFNGRVLDIKQKGMGAIFTIDLNSENLEMELSPTDDQFRELDKRLRNTFSQEHKNKQEEKESD